MTVSDFEMLCPQCGGDDIKVDIHPEPYDAGSIGRIEALCALCGRRVMAYIPAAGFSQQCADVTRGTGAYVIVTSDRTYYGAIETQWSDIHESYFSEVFTSGEIICGRATRWDDETEEVVTMFAYGDLEAMITAANKIAGAST